MLDTVRSVMTSSRPGGSNCLVCHRKVADDDLRVRLRGGALVHRECATYDMRRRRTGSERLGYPRTTH
jgi:hypothetical protein